MLPGSVITFYSYKGGVGRSMALANIAVRLASRGASDGQHRVLVVDWDLEAPGLEKYFAGYSFKEPLSNTGLLGLLTSFRDKPPREVNWRDFVWSLKVNRDSLHLIPSGRETDPEYTRQCQEFDWTGFFANGGGGRLEECRLDWRNEYDFVLTDSRTGLSDAGGLCTIFLPDVVVGMFTPNSQSLFGLRDALELATSARELVPYDRRRLTVIPVASRFDNADNESSAMWLRQAAQAMSSFLNVWVPSNADF